MDESEKFQINEAVGIRDEEGVLIPIGLFWGIYFSSKYQNRDVGLVRTPRNPEIEAKAIIKELNPEMLGQTLLVIPLKLLSKAKNGQKIMGQRSNKKGTHKK